MAGITELRFAAIQSVPECCLIQSMHYRADIDGLRAIAIIPVVLFHAFPLIFTGGFIGVDMFFVISGYLITQIISHDLDAGQFSFTEFYTRRIRRIFPALIAMLLGVSLMGWTFLLPHEFVQLGRHILATAGFFENFLLLREVGYFDKVAETKPLLHIWSLAVEEQFYLAWPLLLVLARSIRLNFFWLAIIIWIGSFAVNLTITGTGVGKAFFLPWTRAWELMTGAVLALAPGGFSVPGRARKIGSHLGWVFLTAAFLLIDKTRVFPGIWATLPTFGTGLLIAAGPSGWLNRHVLARPTLVLMGKISYPLYLWHWPLFSCLYILYGKDSETGLRVLLAFTSVVLAVMTYVWVEKPIRLKTATHQTASILIAMLLMIVALGFAIKRGALPPRLTSKETIRIANAVTDFEFPGGLEVVPDAPTGVYQTQGRSGKTTLVLGDSHAMQYSSRIVLATRQDPNASNKTIFATYSSCPPIPGVGMGWTQKTDQPAWANPELCESVKNYAFDLIRKGEIDVLVIGAIWNGYLANIEKEWYAALEGYFAIREGQRFSLATVTGASSALANLRDFVHSIPPKTRVIVILDNPGGADFNPTDYVGSLRRPWEIPHRLPTRVTVSPETMKISASMRESLQGEGIEFFDPMAFYCVRDVCQTQDQSETPIYRDINHLTSTFVRDKMTPIDDWVKPVSVPGFHIKRPVDDSAIQFHKADSP